MCQKGSMPRLDGRDHRVMLRHDQEAQEETGSDSGAERSEPSQRFAYPRWALAAGLAGAIVLASCVLFFSSQRSEDTLQKDRIISKSSVALDAEVSNATTIRWAKHPDKCVDVEGTGAGARPQLWNCSPTRARAQMFIVPGTNEPGVIRWATNPELCLDSPLKYTLQFWQCRGSPNENIQWSVDAEGRIRRTASPHKCLDIPDERTANGVKLQVWNCSHAVDHGKAHDITFLVHPVDCVWGEWSAWSACTATCGEGSHKRSRRVVREATNGGLGCKGEQLTADLCSNGYCGSLSANATDRRAAIADEQEVNAKAAPLTNKSGAERLSRQLPLASLLLVVLQQLAFR